MQRCTIDGPSQEEGGQDEVVSGSSQFGLKSVEVCCITMEENEPIPVHFIASVKVDVPFLRFFTNKGGKVKEKIEKETKTELFVPLPHEVKKGSCLVVKGKSQREVDDAVGQVQHVLQEVAASCSLEYSHFISLPLAVHPTLVEKVNSFQKFVLSSLTKLRKHEITATENGDEVEKNSDVVKVIPINFEAEDIERKINFMGKVGVSETEINGTSSHAIEQDMGPRIVENDGEVTEEQMNDDTDLEKDNTGLLSKMGCGIEESIFIKPATLHLTVLMLKLWNKERVAAAAEVLQGATSKLLGFLESRPLAVHLRGVECMRGSPAKAHVLYAKVEETDQENRLAQACKIIINEFLEAGLVLEKDKHQELKLHVTLMNTSHRKRKRGKRFGKRIPFDARQILATYGSEDWGEYKIVAVHLSQRFVYGEDGYYHYCASIQLPPLS